MTNNLKDLNFQDAGMVLNWVLIFLVGTVVTAVVGFTNIPKIYENACIVQKIGSFFAA